MSNLPRQVEIHYTRLHGKPLTIYTEELLSQTDLRLKTRASVGADWRQSFAEAWWKPGLIPTGRYVASLIKYYFFQEWFDVLELRGDADEILGYYSDICTPLTKTGATTYATTDLVLDLWLSPERLVKELDWDEFEHVVQHQLMSPELQAQARLTLARLTDEAAQMVYPGKYIE